MSLSHAAGEMFAPLPRALVVLTILLLPAAASAQRPTTQGAAAQTAPGPGSRVLARVNDDAITDFDLSQRVLFAIKTSGLQDSPDLRQRMAPQMLRQMIDERLQVQDSKKLGVKPTDAEIQNRYSEIERAAGLGRGQFRQYLQSVGITPDIATQQIEAQIAWAKIIRRKVRSQVDVSDAEVDDAMSRMRSNVGKTETRVAEIFVPVDRADSVEEGKRSADRIMEQLRRGAPFAAVAQQFSQGASAAAGGDLGWVLPGALDPSLEAAIERVQPRTFSDPVRSASGWHILYVVDRRPFAAARPDDVKLNLVQMTLALPTNASPEETSRATAEAQKAMSGVRQCSDLHVQARQVKGSTSGDLNGLRVGDLAANPQMYEQLPRLPIGGTAGPFRVAEGLQVVALCSKSGGDGLPTRDAISQQLLIQKLDAAGRRYMRDLRRQATIDIKS
ncbi:peptidylprolyl isomerase [Reyranella sp.]|uniref:peptidylprolyl isomerase n=1 Tax=Reyranella sp. TaxID=1929291 RepID=UPI00271D5508|nr:peptidylprolyl isomerase [Reyranella sp.]MDO8976681.1 peptidylprolyl isomerase [Reyranella sp.]